MASSRGWGAPRRPASSSQSCAGLEGTGTAWACKRAARSASELRSSGWGFSSINGVASCRSSGSSSSHWRSTWRQRLPAWAQRFRSCLLWAGMGRPWFWLRSCCNSWMLGSRSWERRAAGGAPPLPNHCCIAVICAPSWLAILASRAGSCCRGCRGHSAQVAICAIRIPTTAASAMLKISAQLNWLPRCISSMAQQAV